jgi:hypothetical protein
VLPTAFSRFGLCQKNKKAIFAFWNSHAPLHHVFYGFILVCLYNADYLFFLLAIF